MQRAPCYTAFVAHLINCVCCRSLLICCRLNGFFMLIQFSDHNQWLRFSLKASLPLATLRLLFQAINHHLENKSPVFRNFIESSLVNETLHDRSKAIKLNPVRGCFDSDIWLGFVSCQRVERLSGAHSSARSKRRVESVRSALKITFTSI